MMEKIQFAGGVLSVRGKIKRELEGLRSGWLPIIPRIADVGRKNTKERARRWSGSPPSLTLSTRIINQEKFPSVQGKSDESSR